MATNIQKEALKLFGTPTGGEGLMTFDPESYSRAVGLPGTEDISGPSPLGAIATRESRTYTPPTRSISAGLETDIQTDPAFLSDVNIAAPSLDDIETINDVPGFENVSPEAIKSLGLVGMTPTSLTRTFNNILSLDANNVVNNGFNIATKGTPIGGALAIAQKALSGAFQTGLAQGNSKQIADLAILANNISNIKIDSLLSTPDKVQSNIEEFFTGLANFIESPIETLQAFGELAGTYAEFGTFNPDPKSFNVNGIEETFLMDAKSGKHVTDMPGFVQSFVSLAGMGSVVSGVQMLAEFIGGESAQQKAERMMENISIAAELPSFTGQVSTPLTGNINFGVTSVSPGLSFTGAAEKGFGEIVSVDLSEYALAGVGNINIDMAEFSRTGTIDGAVTSGQSFIGPEDEQIAEEIATALNAAKDTPEYQAAIAFSEAIGQMASTQFTEIADTALSSVPSVSQAVAQEMAEIKDMISTGVINSPLGLQDYVEAKNIELTPNPETNKQYFEFAYQAIMNGMQREQAQQYAETLGALDVFGQPDFLSLPTDFQNYIQEMQDAASEAIGDRYNAPEGDPSLQDIEIADAVMSITGDLTFQPQHSLIDKQITNVVRDFMARDNITAQEAANKAEQQFARSTSQLLMDPNKFDTIEFNLIDTEDPGFGYGTSAPSIGSGGVDAGAFDAALNEAFDATVDPDVAAAESTDGAGEDDGSGGFGAADDEGGLY